MSSEYSSIQTYSGAHQPSIQCIMEDNSQRVRKMEHEANCSSLSSAKAKNGEVIAKLPHLHDIVN
jgi:hypothetical protein